MPIYIVHVTAYFYDDDVSRLSAMTTLQRLRCYGDDMANPSSSSTATAGYLSLSPLFIYLFFFLPVLQYACLDVL
jgi:hypothetical protein